MNFQANNIHIFPGALPGVLLIEKPLHGELIKMVMQKAGIAVWHVHDYDEAAMALRVFKPNLILASINEDGLDGREIVFQLKCERENLRQTCQGRHQHGGHRL